MVDVPTDFGRWPEVFITRVIGTEDLPDVEILTLPAYTSPEAVPDLEHLERLLLSRSVEEFETIGGSSVNHRGVDACQAALHQVIIDAAVREGLPWSPERIAAYAGEIFSAHPLPVMNSPISGSTCRW
jgi:hypothetical protein